MASLSSAGFLQSPMIPCVTLPWAVVVTIWIPRSSPIPRGRLSSAGAQGLASLEQALALVLRRFWIFQPPPPPKKINLENNWWAASVAGGWIYSVIFE